MPEALVQARPRRFPAVHLALFLATVATTLWAGYQISPLAGRAPTTLPDVVRGGLPFAASLVAILFSHEMGHYLVARRHGVFATLPYFIPVPFGAGTLGAVIRMRSAIPSRRAALDIAAAGPIAGLLVAVPLLLWGLAHSSVHAAAAAPVGSSLESPFALVRALLEGRELVLGEPGSQFFGDSLLTLAAARLVHGVLPAGVDVALHPVAFAAWLGLLVTTLNLIPLGQLDGGHVLYALVGQRLAHLGSRIASFALLAAGLFLSWNWLIWWAITRFAIGLRHPPSLSEEPLDPARAAVAVLSLVLFALTFVPVPVSF
jgi:membrane-associated protease RseP (regulator of RpoE activity)